MLPVIEQVKHLNVFFTGMFSPMHQSPGIRYPGQEWGLHSTFHPIYQQEAMVSPKVAERAFWQSAEIAFLLCRWTVPTHFIIQV